MLGFEGAILKETTGGEFRVYRVTSVVSSNSESAFFDSYSIL